MVRSTLFAASVALAALSFAPHVADAAAIAIDRNGLRVAAPLPLFPSESKNKKLKHTKKVKSAKFNKRLILDPLSPVQHLFNGGLRVNMLENDSSFARRRHRSGSDTVIVNGDRAHVHIKQDDRHRHGRHGRHDGADKVVINGNGGHYHIRQRRSPQPEPSHRHHRHHRHRRSPVTVMDNSGDSYRIHEARGTAGTLRKRDNDVATFSPPGAIGLVDNTGALTASLAVAPNLKDLYASKTSSSPVYMEYLPSDEQESLPADQVQCKMIYPIVDPVTKKQSNQCAFYNTAPDAPSPLSLGGCNASLGDGFSDVFYCDQKSGKVYPATATTPDAAPSRRQEDSPAPMSVSMVFTPSASVEEVNVQAASEPEPASTKTEWATSTITVTATAVAVAQPTPTTTEVASSTINALNVGVFANSSSSAPAETATSDPEDIAASIASSPAPEPTPAPSAASSSAPATSSLEARAVFTPVDTQPYQWHFKAAKSS